MDHLLGEWSAFNAERLAQELAQESARKHARAAPHLCADFSADVVPRFIPRGPSIPPPQSWPALTSSGEHGALERLWLTSIEEALTLMELGRGERLYAIAFWLFYAETGTRSPPRAPRRWVDDGGRKRGSEGRDGYKSLDRKI